MQTPSKQLIENASKLQLHYVKEQIFCFEYAMLTQQVYVDLAECPTDKIEDIAYFAFIACVNAGRLEEKKRMRTFLHIN